jgi:hypothetical protein
VNLLKRKTLACLVQIGGFRVAHEIAQVEEVLLSGGALRKRVPAPLEDEFGGLQEWRGF